MPIKCCCNGELNNTVTRVRSSVTGKLSQDTRLLCCMKPGSLRETATLALPEGATLKRLDLASPYSNPCLSLAISVTWRPFPFGLTTMLSVSSFDLKSWFFHIFFWNSSICFCTNYTYIQNRRVGNSYRLFFVGRGAKGEAYYMNNDDLLLFSQVCAFLRAIVCLHALFHACEEESWL